MKRAILYLTAVSLSVTASFAQTKRTPSNPQKPAAGATQRATPNRVNVAPTNLDPGKASGQIVVDGKATKLNHAYAYMIYDFFDEKRNRTELLFTEAPVPDEALEAVGVTAYQKMKEAGNRYVVQHQIASGEHALDFVSVQEVGTLSSDSSAMFGTPILRTKIELVKNDGGVVEGRIHTAAPERHDDHTYEFNVAFHAPVKSDPAKAPVTAKNGVGLPVGGGAPGAAFLKFQKALEAAKTAREMAGVLLVSLTARLVEETNPSPYAGPVPKELEEVAFQLMRVAVIERPQVTGGFISGDKATIAVVGFKNIMGSGEVAQWEKVSARFNMHLENGQWKRGFGSIQMDK